MKFEEINKQQCFSVAESRISDLSLSGLNLISVINGKEIDRYPLDLELVIKVVLEEFFSKNPEIFNVKLELVWRNGNGNTFRYFRRGELNGSV